MLFILKAEMGQKLEWPAGGFLGCCLPFNEGN